MESDFIVFFYNYFLLKKDIKELEAIKENRRNISKVRKL